MDRSQVKVKLRKYNPKPKKVCVGQYLSGFFQALYEMLKNSEDKLEEKSAAAWAMNMTLLEITTQWCKCPWCKHTGAKIEEFLKANKEQNKSHQSLD